MYTIRWQSCLCFNKQFKLGLYGQKINVRLFRYISTIMIWFVMRYDKTFKDDVWFQLFSDRFPEHHHWPVKTETIFKRINIWKVYNWDRRKYWSITKWHTSALTSHMTDVKITRLKEQNGLTSHWNCSSHVQQVVWCCLTISECLHLSPLWKNQSHTSFSWPKSEPGSSLQFIL